MDKLKTQYTQKDLETDWDKFAETDPMWAVLRDDSKKNRGWKEEDFYATGVEIVKDILTKAKQNNMQNTGTAQ
jgi:hypothetical protein